jgi:hypothetical protein
MSECPWEDPSQVLELVDVDCSKIGLECNPDAE